MKPFLFVANFKMNPVSREDAENYVRVLKREMENKVFSRSLGVLCPSILHTSLFLDLPPSFFLGAQHGFPEKSGAFTGEVSYAMLKNFGVEYVIIGHSERKQYFGETEEAIRMRTEAALKYLLRPIVCIGETEEEFKAGKRDAILKVQVQSVITGLSKMQAEKIIFAYEPRYAIGTGITPSQQEIVDAKKTIRTFLDTTLGENCAERIQILYGGSVKAGNLAEVALETGMDGVLVGKESLSPYEVVKMLAMADESKNN